MSRTFNNSDINTLDNMFSKLSVVEYGKVLSNFLQTLSTQMNISWDYYIEDRVDMFSSQEFITFGLRGNIDEKSHRQIINEVRRILPKFIVEGDKIASRDGIYRYTMEITSMDYEMMDKLLQLFY